MPEASIIIASYKQYDYCSKAIKSINEHTDKVDFEIIVCNDDHDPNTDLGQLLNELHSKGIIRLIKINPRLGGHRPVTQLGINHSSGEFLVFMNDDVEIPAESNLWLRKLIDFLKLNGNEKVASVTPASYHANNTVYWIGKDKYPPAMHDFLHHKKTDPKLPTRPRKTVFNNMACFVTRRAYWTDGLGWDHICPEEIIHYGSDSAWCFAMNQRGYTHWVIPEVWVYHYNIFNKRRK